MNIDFHFPFNVIRHMTCSSGLHSRLRHQLCEPCKQNGVSKTLGLCDWCSSWTSLIWHLDLPNNICYSSDLKMKLPYYMRKHLHRRQHSLKIHFLRLSKRHLCCRCLKSIAKLYLRQPCLYWTDIWCVYMLNSLLATMLCGSFISTYYSIYQAFVRCRVIGM